MNCEHISRNAFCSNEFLPTAYSPNQRCEQRANNSNHPITTTVFRIAMWSYSQRPTFGFLDGEYLLLIEMHYGQQNEQFNPAAVSLTGTA